MLAAARSLPGARLQFTASTFDNLAGTDQIRTSLEANKPAAEIVASWQADLQQFRRVREQYLLY
jgi:uncharacterized protein YbbC (DUF1343 family)